MTEPFFEYADADNEKFLEFFDVFTQEICEKKTLLQEAVISCRPIEETKMRVKIQLKDENQKRYSVSTGSNFSDYAAFSKFMYKLIDECRCAGITEKIYSHRSGFQIVFDLVDN